MRPGCAAGACRARAVLGLARAVEASGRAGAQHGAALQPAWAARAAAAARRGGARSQRPAAGAATANTRRACRAATAALGSRHTHRGRRGPRTQPPPAARCHDQPAPRAAPIGGHAARRDAAAALTRSASASQATYDQFTALLPETECRYAVYDFAYIGKARHAAQTACKRTRGRNRHKFHCAAAVPDALRCRS
jgi:hypothetical protein